MAVVVPFQAENADGSQFQPLGAVGCGSVGAVEHPESVPQHEGDEDGPHGKLQPVEPAYFAVAHRLGGPVYQQYRRPQVGQVFGPFAAGTAPGVQG